MPTLLAMIIASLAGWIVESPLRAIVGPVGSGAVSLLVAAVAFFVAKQRISGLRGHS